MIKYINKLCMLPIINDGNITEDLSSDIIIDKENVRLNVSGIPIGNNKIKISNITMNFNNYEPTVILGDTYYNRCIDASLLEDDDDTSIYMCGTVIKGTEDGNGYKVLCYSKGIDSSEYFNILGKEIDYSDIIRLCTIIAEKTIEFRNDIDEGDVSDDFLTQQIEYRIGTPSEYIQDYSGEESVYKVVTESGKVTLIQTLNSKSFDEGYGHIMNEYENDGNGGFRLSSARTSFITDKWGNLLSTSCESYNDNMRVIKDMVAECSYNNTNRAVINLKRAITEYNDFGAIVKRTLYDSIKSLSTSVDKIATISSDGITYMEARRNGDKAETKTYFKAYH